MMFLAEVVFKYRPAYLEKRLNAEVMKLASEMAVRTSMAYLDKEQLLHCAMCAQRFGLRMSKVKYGDRIRDVYLCPNHLKNAIAEQPVPA
jgi:hypothetical protein